MRIGIQLPEVEREVRWPEYLAMAQAAEEVGFDSIWLGDHLLYRDGDDEGHDRGPWASRNGHARTGWDAPRRAVAEFAAAHADDA